MNGNVVAGSDGRYLPFGDWRVEPTADVTDRGYTGHKHNNTGASDFGLIYMNARYYVPGNGRFASADTIIPDPNNPQSYNRYSYTYNNPVKYTDPSGHCIAEDPGITQVCSHPTPDTGVEPIWVRSPIDSPDWIQYYGYTEFAENKYRSTNGQHAGLDYGEYYNSFGERNRETNQWDFSKYGADEEYPLIPVYAGCECTVSSTSTPGSGESYAPGRVNLTSNNEDYSDFLLIYGHLMNIEVVPGQEVTPDTIIGYLELTERHVHLEIRRKSDNHFVNPLPYLSEDLQTQMLTYGGNSPQTRYRSGLGFPNNPYEQPSGHYNGQPPLVSLNVPQ